MTEGAIVTPELDASFQEILTNAFLEAKARYPNNDSCRQICKEVAGEIKKQVSKIAVIEGLSTPTSGFTQGDWVNHNAVVIELNGIWGAFVPNDRDFSCLTALDAEALRIRITETQGGVWPRGWVWEKLINSFEGETNQICYIRFRGQDEYASHLTTI